MKDEIKKGQKVILPATYKGLTEDGLAIVSVGTTDNYILTFDPLDLHPLTARPIGGSSYLKSQ